MRISPVLIAAYLLWSSLPGWARLGGGSSYSSSSTSSSSYSGGGGGGGGGGGAGLAFIGICMVVLIGFMHKLRQSGLKDRSLLRHGVVAAIAGIILFWMSPYMIGLVGLIYLVLLNKASDQTMNLIGNFSDEIVVYVTTLNRQESSGSGGKSAMAGLLRGRLAARQGRPRLNLLLQHDPNFSTPVFREFVVLLYCQALMERVDGQFHHSRPFLQPAVADRLAKRNAGLKSVESVIVGYCRINNCDVVDGRRIVLAVELESNAVEDQKGVVRRELWTFERKVGILTQPPEKTAVLSCPGCGYSGEFPSGGVCPQCERSNRKGEFGWVVSSVTVLSTESFNPVLSSSSLEEAGTHQPTVLHPQLARRKEEFLTRHPDFDWTAFWAKCTHMFLNLQQGWSERDLQKLRPFETDSLYRTHQYWVELYREQGRINKLDDIKIEKWELSNIVLDAFYESVTARVHASMTDITTDEKGHLISGKPKPKRFTEYWTFIRRIGYRQPQGDQATQCPSCGAPLDKIGQTGECGYCATVVTRGDFGWVLSNIEQDEVYAIAHCG